MNHPAMSHLRRPAKKGAADAVAGRSRAAGDAELVDWRDGWSPGNIDFPSSQVRCLRSLPAHGSIVRLTPESGLSLASPE